MRNHRSFFPPAESVMYLSGPPLHVITLALVEKVRRARPEIPLSFSAGVDNRNFADCVALGLAPVTTCTDLLKPGGYGRLPRYLENLEERMREKGARTIEEYCRGAALDPAVAVERAKADPRYRAGGLRPPRRIGRRLATFDCINCDKCLPACPNDANFAYETGPASIAYRDYRVEGGRALPVDGGTFVVAERHQIASFQDFCNDCGNCDTFCPEDGGPYRVKPRFFGTLAAWRRDAPRDGLFVEPRQGGAGAWARLGGAEYRLDVDGDRAVFSDGRITLELRHAERAPTGATVAAGTPDGHPLDFRAYLTVAALVDGVLDLRRANPVNAGVVVPWDPGE
ncbi:MAG: hypothetical protein U0599_22020 [Vicinamibacteria bacterium]